MQRIRNIAGRVLPASVRRAVKRVLMWVSPNFAKREHEKERQQSRADSEQIRLRTEEELQAQARGLAEIRDVFDGCALPYYISGGTLLGIIREGDFIRWDWDVGIDVRVEDVVPKQDALIAALTAAGFDIVTHTPDPTNFKINAVKYGTRYEVAGLIKVGNIRYRKAYHYHDVLLQEPTRVQLRGESYTTFSKPEAYLEWLYGDWRMPIRTVDKTAYVTSSSRTSRWSRLVTRITSLMR